MSFATPLVMGVFWAVYIAAVLDEDVTPDRFFGVLAFTSVAWTALAGLALSVSVRERRDDSSNPLVLPAMVAASVQVFLGLVLTPIYFAIWHEVPTASW